MEPGDRRTMPRLLPQSESRLDESLDRRPDSDRSPRGDRDEGGASILERVAAGDPAAVEECIDAYGGLVWSLARRLSPNISDADDAVQEVYLSIWSSADRFDPSVAKESTFVTTIARRRLIDRLRRAGRTPQAESIDSDASFHEIPARTIDPELLAESAEAAQALESMPPKAQEVLRMAFYDGLTHREISDALDMPLGTVKTRIRRGLLKLRDQLERDASSAPHRHSTPSPA